MVTSSRPRSAELTSSPCALDGLLTLARRHAACIEEAGDEAALQLVGVELECLHARRLLHRSRHGP
jgi:hypothetical protein